MLKGKSKIELFNSVTGEKTGEFENENIVTNAVYRIANLDDTFGLMRHRTGTLTAHLANMQPLMTTMYGGVLLWDNNIAEDANIITQPADVNTIGYGGAGYSGDDKYRGNYNINESGNITDEHGNIIGYRHVWDFNTDKANGTIKCLSLTSQHGGNFGTRENQSGETNFSAGEFYFSKENTWENIVTESYNKVEISASDLPSVDTVPIYISKQVNGDLQVYVMKYVANNTGTLYRVTIANPNTLAITQSQLTAKSVETLIAEVPSNARVYVNNDVINVISGTGTTITHTTYPFDGSASNTVTVATPSTILQDYATTYAYASPNAPFYANGYYYYVNVSSGVYSLIKVSPAGELISTIALNGLYSILDIAINDTAKKIYMQVTNGKYQSFSQHPYYTRMVILGFDDNISGSIFPWYTSSYSTGKSIGFCGTSDDSNVFIVSEYATQKIVLNPCFWSNYLGTINNLATPITKTPAQVMKITYELTETTT